jgi:hypothetical protein
MELIGRIQALAEAIGADIKALTNRSGDLVATPSGAMVLWHQQTFAVPGMSSAARVVITLAPGSHDDENTAEMLSGLDVIAIPGDGQLDVTLQSGEPFSGPIRLFWETL